MYFLLNGGLVLHICGICLMVGMAVAGFVTYRRLFISLYSNREEITAFVATATLFGRLQMIGALLIIAGGIMMMVAFSGVFMEQIWFKIKMLLLLLLILNVPLIFRPANKKLRLFITQEQIRPLDVARAKQLFNLFYLLQFFIFLSIFILSVFRFN